MKNINKPIRRANNNILYIKSFSPLAIVVNKPSVKISSFNEIFQHNKKILLWNSKISKKNVNLVCFYHPTLNLSYNRIRKLLYLFYLKTNYN